MAKLPSRTELTSIADGDLLHVVDISDTTSDPSGTSKKITKANFVNNIPTTAIQNSAITNAKVATGIDAAKLADGSVSNTEFQYINSLSSNAQDQIDGKLASSLTDANIFVGNVSNQAAGVAMSGDATISNAGALTIANNAVTTDKILDANVTLAKVANAAANDKLLGAGNTGSGSSYAEITLGTNLSMSGTTLNASGGGVSDGDKGDITVSGSGATWTIDNNAVTTAKIADSNVTLAKIANISNNSFLGNDSGGAAAPEELTGTEATALLDNVVGDSGAGGTKGLVPAPAAGDAASNKYLKADGTWDTVAGAPSIPFTFALSDESTVISTGTAVVKWRAPYACTVDAVRASLSTASSSGTPTFDINESGTSILSTKITIDANEKTSTTAATAPVISDSSLADDAEITFDIDVAGTGAIGAKVTLFLTKT